MNGKLKEYCESIGMTVTGNKAYGIVKGFEVNFTIFAGDNVSPYRWHISFFASSEQKGIIESGIKTAAIKNLNPVSDSWGMTLAMNDFTAGGHVKRMPEVLDTVFKLITDNGGKGSEFCPYCGNEMNAENSRKVNVGWTSITIENDCVDKINAKIEEENAEFKNAPNNILRGTLGAVIGGVAGMAVAVVLMYIGIITAFAAIISIALGAFLYTKFGGKPNVIMVVIVTAVTMVFMVAAVFISYIIAAGMAATELGLQASEALELFKICMEDEEFSRMFYVDLVMVIVFSIIGAVVQVVGLSQKIKRQKKIN